MSHWTRRGAWLSIGILILQCAPSFAGSFEEAQAGLSQGYNDFYSALRASSNQDLQTIHALSQRYVDPAKAKMSESLGESIANSLKKNGVTLKTGSADSNSPISLGAYNPKDFMDEPGKESGTSQAGASGLTLNADHSADGAVDRAPAAQEYLDSSGIPAELQFPGKAPAKSKPQPR